MKNSATKSATNFEIVLPLAGKAGDRRVAWPEGWPTPPEAVMRAAAMNRILNLACILAAATACAESPTMPIAEDSMTPVSIPEEPASKNEGVIEVVAVPSAAESTTVMPPQPSNTRICRRERRTGTNRTVRVCRTQAEINQREIESKETFEVLRRSQQEYNQ